jgi:hypothetical protein
MKNKFELWDKYAERIIQCRDSEYIRLLVYSLSLPEEVDLEKAIRDKDLDLLETIVNQDGPLSFLKGVNDPLLHYTLVETILRNHKVIPAKTESLIVREIDRNLQHLEAFLRQFPIAIARGWISVKELQPETVKFLADKLAAISGLNWEMQKLLLDIGRREGGVAILDVFMKRIRTDEELRKEKNVTYERYEAIPFQFDPRLQEFIS